MVHLRSQVPKMRLRATTGTRSLSGRLKFRNACLSRPDWRILLKDPTLLETRVGLEMTPEEK
jgi:hypothetical protein